MKFTSPTPSVPVDGGRYVSISKAEFERMLNERDSLIEALRQQSRHNHELIKALADSASVRNEPPVPAEYEFLMCRKEGCKREHRHSGPHTTRR